ncbi:MAG: chitobiase/beta-hexosaminidase C-terminal domain-containing protein [Bacteroidales bacterium]|nr:chitobiase/beta-hexosaminidase C-terminal domain-containing protein [Bacteroidales bacterium]
MKKKAILFSIVTLCAMLFAVTGFAQTTYTFNNYPAGVQYAQEEVHVLDNDVTVTTTECHFTQQLRVYSSSAHDGFFYTNALPLYIDSLAFNMGYKVDDVNIYGSVDGNTWTLVGSIPVTTTSYADYGLSFGSSNYNYFKFDVDGNQQIRVVSMTIYYKSSGPSGNTAATPTFTPSPGFYTSPVTVSISSETANASIYYTTDGTVPTTSSTLYTTPISLNQTTTVKAIATAAGYTNSPAATATYTFPITVSNIAAFKAQTSAPTSQVFTIGNDVTYVFRQGSYTYVKDASAGLLIYGTTITTPYNEGDQISGLTGTRSVYADQVEMSASQNTAAATANTGSVAPVVVTISDLIANYDDYDAQLVTIEGVTFPTGFSGSSTTFTQGTNELTLYNRFSIDTTLAAGATVNITGFAAIHNGTIQIYPRYNQDITAPMLTPVLTITAPANGSNFSTLDTLPIGVNIENFTLGTDGYLKVETPLLTAIGLTNPVYLDQAGLSMLLAATLSPLPAGTHTITCSLVDLNNAALTPAVNATTTFTVTMPVLDAPVITAAGSEAEGDNTFYFNATVTMTAGNEAAIHYTTDGTAPTEASTLYTAPFQVTATTTVKAIAVKAYWQTSDVTTLDVTITTPTVETPVFSPVAGTYADSVTFSLSCATENAVVRYTTDGSEPTETSTAYSTPITLTATTTVKAKAFKTDWQASETATAVYSIVYDPVLTVSGNALAFTSTQLSQTFTVGGAHLTDPITLTVDNTHFTVSPTTIANPNSNTVVTVTFDGTEPATGTITAVSDTLSATVALTATAQLPTPVLTPATAVEDSLVTVTMSCTVADAAIHYTTDGTEPTATSAVYSAPVTFNTPGTYTVKALAMKSGWENSAVATGTYTVNEPQAPDTVAAPVITPATASYYEPQTVTITCATEGAVIRYTTDGTVPTESAAVYSAPFTVNATTTITAKAWKAGWIASETASTTISFPVQVANIAAFKAEAATNEERQIMSDVTFVFRSGRFMFVEDNTGAMLIYDYNTPVITTQYNEGDVIEGGIFGKYTVYQGMVEMLPTHNALAATGTPVTVTPTDATVTNIKAQYTDVYEAKLVHLSNVEFISATEFVQNGDTMAIYNRFNTLTTEIAAGDLADVTGFVSYSTSHGYQIFPRGNDDIDIHSVVVMDTVATPEYYLYRAGEFYFMRLTCATEGASIYYTQDGSTPDETSLQFTDDVPLPVHNQYILKAVAMKEGMVNSEIAVYDYDPDGIEDYVLRDNVSVWPNPATNRVFIGVEGESFNIEKVELYNAYGQMVDAVDVNGAVAEISVGTLATGTYFAKVFTDKGVVTMPVIRK